MICAKGILPEAGALESAKSYREKKAKPAYERIVKGLRSLFNKYLRQVTGAMLPLEDATGGAPSPATAGATILLDLRPIDRLDTRYEWRIGFPTSGVMRVEATTTSLFSALRHLLEEGCDARFLGAENCMFQFEPRQDVVKITRDLPPGTYLTLVTVRGTAGGAKCCMAVWPQTDGNNGGWENYAPTTLMTGKEHVFASVRTITDWQDGLNVNLNMTGFNEGDVLDIIDIRMLRVAPAGPSRRAGDKGAAEIQPQKGSSRETVRGEEAVVCRSADAYMVAKIPVNVPRILPDEKLVFTIRATLPEGAKTGRLIAGIFEAVPGEPGRGTLVGNVGLPADGWKDLSGSVSGKSLGKKRGKFTVIIYKVRGTDAIAVSRVSWKVE